MESVGCKVICKDNNVAVKSLDFAVRIVNLCRTLKRRNREFVLHDQILRSGTSIGANVSEANSAQSKADFISKISIALKECNETGYWLELLHRTETLTNPEYESLISDNRQLFAILTAILKSAKRTRP